MKRKITTFLLASLIILSSSFPSLALTENQKAQSLVKNGWIKGRGGDTQNLDLDENLTRAEVARIVCAITDMDEKAEELKTKKSIFNDVQTGNWANGYINLAVQKGYVSGYPDKTFKPNRNISYDELFSILIRLDPNWKSYIKSTPFSKNWASIYINAALDKNLLDDVQISSFPDYARRGSTFSIIYNMDRTNYANIHNSIKNDKYDQSQTYKNTDESNSKKNIKLENYTVKTSNGNKVVRGKLLDNEDELLELVNREREKNGLSPYKKGDSFLSNLSDQRAPEIAYSYSHTRPDGSNPIMAVILNGSNTAGENIAYGQDTPQDVINAWMNSPGHKANILNPRFKTISQKAFLKDNNLIYWVQIFASKSGEEKKAVYQNPYENKATTSQKTYNEEKNKYSQNKNSNNSQNSSYNKNNYSKVENPEYNTNPPYDKNDLNKDENSDNQANSTYDKNDLNKDENSDNQTNSTYDKNDLNKDENSDNQTNSTYDKNDLNKDENSDSQTNSTHDKNDLNKDENSDSQTNSTYDKSAAEQNQKIDENGKKEIQDKNTKQENSNKNASTTLYVYMQKSSLNTPDEPFYTFKGVNIRFKPQLSGFLNPKYVNRDEFSNWELLSGDATIINPSSLENAILVINSTSEPVSIRANFR